MAECFWDRSNDVKPKLLPEVDSTPVRGNYIIELHRSKALSDRFTLRMFTHLGGNPLTTGILCNDIPAITDMISQADLVGFNVVGSQDDALLVYCDVSRCGY